MIVHIVRFEDSTRNRLITAFFSKDDAKKFLWNESYKIAESKKFGGNLRLTIDMKNDYADLFHNAYVWYSWDIVSFDLDLDTDNDNTPKICVLLFSNEGNFDDMQVFKNREEAVKYSRIYSDLLDNPDDIEWQFFTDVEIK